VYVIDLLDVKGKPKPETLPPAEEEVKTDKTKPKVEVPQGPPPKKLVVNDIEEGTGPVAKKGDEVTVHYVGVDYKTGKQFDASWDREETFTFIVGGRLVIKGWDQGVEGMKVGGRRELVVPPEFGYGSQQVGTIKPNSTLVFVIDLLAVNKVAG
jgi:peptidylprolyl isomerase